METRDLIGWLGAFFSVVLFSSAGRTYYTIMRANNVGNNSVYSAMAMLGNCSVWAIYSLPFAHKDWKVLVTNCIGAGLQLVFIAIYIRAQAAQAAQVQAAEAEGQPVEPGQVQEAQAAQARAVRRTLVLLAGVVSAVLVVVLVVFGGWRAQESRAVALGIIGAGTASIMYVVPAVEVAVSVIYNGNMENFPLIMTLASIANAVVWMVYAHIGKSTDTILTTSNGIGAGAATLLLLAYGGKLALQQGNA